MLCKLKCEYASVHKYNSLCNDFKPKKQFKLQKWCQGDASITGGD